jgi:hypothetical protein
LRLLRFARNDGLKASRIFYIIFDFRQDEGVRQKRFRRNGSAEERDQAADGKGDC